MNPRVTGVVVLATGVYFLLGLRLIKGFRRHFRGSGQVRFYFHSDNDPSPYLPEGSGVRYVHAAHQGWPLVARSKYDCILADESQMRADGVEQVCYLDADSDFSSDFGDDWLPPVSLFGAEHFCNSNRDYPFPTFETNPASTACLLAGRGTAGLVYYYGCFWGGQIDAVLGMCRVCKAMTDQDVARGIKTIWDDESYLNKYLHDCREPDAVILDRALPFAVSDKGGMEKNSRSLVFDLADHHDALLACRDEPILLKAGKVVVPPAAEDRAADDDGSEPKPARPPSPVPLPGQFLPEDRGAEGPVDTLAVLCGLCGAHDTPEAALDAVAGLRTEAQWRAVVAAAIEHDVAPLLAFRLLDRASDQISPVLREGLDVYLEGERLSGIAAADQLRLWLEDLAAAGIEAMPYKGPRLARDLYGELGLRSSLDLDVLLPPERIDDALEGLIKRGFEIRMRDRRIARHRVTGNDYLLLHPELLPVEPHWAVALHQMAFDLDYDALWRDSFAGEFEGAPCRVPSTEWELLLLCVHGGKHRWCRLKWLCDLAAFVRAHPELDWAALQALAERQGCRRVLHLGLLLAQRLLGVDLPEPVSTAACHDRGTRVLADEVIRKMRSGHTGHPSPAQLRYYLWQLRERMRDRLRYAARTIFVPRPEHYSVVTLPSVMGWAYYPLKLVLDYGLWPLHPVLRPLYRRYRG